MVDAHVLLHRLPLDPQAAVLQLGHEFPVHPDEVGIAAHASAHPVPRPLVFRLGRDVVEQKVTESIDRVSRDDLVPPLDGVVGDVGDLLHLLKQPTLVALDLGRHFRRHPPLPQQTDAGPQALDDVARLQEPERVGEIRQHGGETEGGQRQDQQQQGAGHEIRLQRHAQPHRAEARHDVETQHRHVHGVAQEHHRHAGVSLGRQLHNNRDDSQHDRKRSHERRPQRREGVSIIPEPLTVPPRKIRSTM